MGSKVRGSLPARNFRSFWSLRALLRGSRSSSSSPKGMLDLKVKAVERHTEMFKERLKTQQQGKRTGVNDFAWRLSHSRQFEGFWAVVIVMNAVSLGVQLDLCTRGSCGLAVFRVLDFSFTAMFLLELLIRCC